MKQDTLLHIQLESTARSHLCDDFRSSLASSSTSCVFGDIAGALSSCWNRDDMTCQLSQQCPPHPLQTHTLVALWDCASISAQQWRHIKRSSCGRPPAYRVLLLRGNLLERTEKKKAGVLQIKKQSLTVCQAHNAQDIREEVVCRT